MILRRERERGREQRRRSDRTKAKELIERRARSRQSRSKRISGGAGRVEESFLVGITLLVGGNQRGQAYYLSSDSGVTMDLQQYEHLVFVRISSFLSSPSFRSPPPYIDTRRATSLTKRRNWIYELGNTACHCIGFKYPRGFVFQPFPAYDQFQSLKGKTVYDFDPRRVTTRSVIFF